MRYAVLTTSYPQSDDDPSGHFVRTEVNSLVQQGHDVTVFCPGFLEHSSPNANPAVVRLGATQLFGWPGALVRLQTRPWSLGQLPLFLLRARNHLRTGTFDRAVVHWLVPCGWPLSTALSCPTEIVVHGSDARLLARLPAWLRERLLLALFDRGHRLRFVAAHLRALVATTATWSWVMNSAVVMSDIVLPPLPSKTEARAALGLDSEMFVATIIARLVPSKRVGVALERAQLPPGARVFVVGSGPCYDDLRRRFPTVVFLGGLKRTQTLLWLTSSDVLLNASRSEGAPTVIREARALHVPVWTAACDEVLNWAATDAGIRICPELA